MACTAAELAALTPALNGIPLGLVPYAELAILCQILQASDPMADCSASAMVENAKCLACSIPPGLVQFASLYLLCQILENGGGGGGAFTVGSGSPEGVVTGDPGDRYWDDVGFVFWTKVSGTGTTTLWTPG